METSIDHPFKKRMVRMAATVTLSVILKIYFRCSSFMDCSVGLINLKISLIMGYEPQTSGVGSDRSANCARAKLNKFFTSR